MTKPGFKEPFAREPKLSDPTCRWDWSGPEENDHAARGVLDISSTNIDGSVIDLRGIQRLSIHKCRLTRVLFEGAESDLVVSIAGSVVSQCDLSGMRLDDVHQSSFRSVKLVGNNLSDSSFQDCEFGDCAIRLVNLRVAQLKRVRFTDCHIEEPDLYGATLSDVSFPESRLETFNVDAVKAAGVDLRGCRSLGLLGISRLDGFLISDAQLPGLAFTLGRALGLQIET